ncbi:hypothetical protein GB931_00815 [Modestobacter sp. I12A-02628]|uniref:Nuclear transport factor 2 family protein n=1 Tax=Goekera deserti TaxID=2497753 RepID=A0A7K3WFY3_9ACTN|nr:nuclear transport factor 2 family protein [Goekera deserti]MPQ96483.1 hypothetical protein [Goekera deserti]NDI47202.1 hypothetical protein [Goekera deserti]NEL55398.1 nuclear transport factor 2 family protein [Goekera deserti]
MSRDDDVQELIDRARISDAVQAYCDHCDSADVEAALALFTDDGAVDLGGGAVHRGQLELRDLFEDRFTLYSAISFHCSDVRLVRYDGRTASTTTHLIGFHEAADVDRVLHIWGTFEDQLVKDGRRWLFRHRHLRVAGINHTTACEVPRRFDQIAHRRAHPAAAGTPVRGIRDDLGGGASRVTRLRADRSPVTTG